MQKNDHLTLTVERLSGDFSGIAQADGLVTFIPFALPGETVAAHVLSVKKRHAFAKAERIEHFSPDRVAPKCPLFGRCGGCACQHLDYPKQLETKRQHVADCFSRLNALPVAVAPVTPSPISYRYRNKAAMPVGQAADGRLFAGFYAPRSHRLLAVTDCPLVDDHVNRAVRHALEWLNAARVSAYDEATGRGLIRHIVTRVNRAGFVMLSLVLNGDRLPDEAGFIDHMRALPGLVSLNVIANKRRDNVILGDTARTLWGKPYLEETLLGTAFRLSPLSFFQVNTAQAERLFQTALDVSGVTRDDTVADVYCGTGTLSLLFAKKVKRVRGIEIVAPAIDNARNNARLNGVDNAFFHVGAAEDVLPALVNDGYAPSVVLLDPPRKGVDQKVLDAILFCGAAKIVYISCYPATQARDCAYLAAHGFKVAACQPVDMFPQTEHVETVVLMLKSVNPEGKSHSERPME